MGVTGHTATDDGAVESVEGCEQRGDTVTLVVVCHGAAPAGLQRQARLSPVKRLDLAFSSIDTTTA